MKKIILLTLLMSSFFVNAQILNFKFQFLTTSGTSLLTSQTVVFNYNNQSLGPFQVLDVDLSSSVCEGQTIQMKNLTNGSYNSPLETIGSTTKFDAGWGLYYQENCYSNANWAATNVLYSNQNWYLSSKNITIPYSPTTYPVIAACQGGGNETMPSSWMAQLPSTSAFTYKYLLFSPKLNAGFLGITGGKLTACNRGLAIRIKVKKGPSPLVIAPVCNGTTANVNIPAGVTASNWIPSNPSVTPVTAPGNYTVTLTQTTPATGCALTQPLTINALGGALTPSITGATTVCNASQSTFYGAETNYTYDAKWEIIQCNFMGTPTGVVLYSTPSNGTYVNANFTLPTTLGQGYFLLRYTAHGFNEYGCELTKSVDKIIRIAPWLLAGYDGTTEVCLGQSTTLCAAVPQGYTVNWSFAGIRGAQTSACATITPTVSTTGTLNITSTQYGCVSTATIPITVMANNANLTVNPTITGGVITTVSVTPSFTPAAGYQSYFVVEKLTALTANGGTTIPGTQSPNSYATAPTCWKDVTGQISLDGYNPVGGSVACFGTPNWGTGYYRITRYTKNANCDWTSKYAEIGGSGNRLANFATSKDNEESEIEKIYSDLNVLAFPNPTSGIVKIDSEEKIQSIHITTITGALVKDVNNEQEVDLSTYPAGMYFFTITTENAKKTIKIIKE